MFTRLICLSLVVYCAYAQTCNDRYSGRTVRAAGSWSAAPLWNAVEPNGLMKLDTTICQYTVTVSGLRANTRYEWKVTLDNAWGTNFGCNNGNCAFTSSPTGTIRFLFKPDNNQLTTDYNTDTVDFTIPCVDQYKGRTVRAVGEWNNWVIVDLQNVMRLDESLCSYVLSVGGQKPSTNLQWKVAIGDAWTTSFGCGTNGQANCGGQTDASGAIRYIFNPANNQLSSDLNIGEIGTTPAPTPTQPGASTPAPTTPTPSVNPVKPCTSNCPACTNNFATKLVRATGDWTLDAGSDSLWNGAEPLGLMTFDQKNCVYTLVIKGLLRSTNYNWKATINDNFKENYGCNGLAGPNCQVKSNSVGAIRLLFKPSTNPPQLTHDYNVGDCGDGVCEEGETCKFCPEDCGECPPPECGDGICEDGETYMTCPSDCPNELPGCEVFRDESCRSGSQNAANEGVAKRRWQTPKPGSKDYRPSYQDYYALTGYADIKYTSPARTEADVCIVTIHKDQSKVTFTYYFNDEAQSANCKRFSQSHKTDVALRVTASDGTKLVLAPIALIWNAQPLTSRQGDYRNGQKGAVVEFFGWPHKDVEKECELVAKAGYLGVKLFPIHEQVMSYQPFEDAMNPWYFMYQPVSYQLNGRAGTREELRSLIRTCRSLGLRVYFDAVLNHMVGAGNDMSDHRNPGAGCTKWGNKTSSAPEDRESPFYTHAFTYKYNPNTGEAPSQEFPAAALGPDDFHCDRALGAWTDLFIMNNGWLQGLTDIDTSKDNVRERQAAYVVEVLSLGISGFRIDAAKHMSPEDLSALMKKIQAKLGGQFPDDFFSWLEVITGGESNLIWTGPSWYGSNLENMLRRDLGSQSEVDKIKMWDGLYPKEPGNNPMNRKRVVIQNDDHDQQTPGSSSRDMGPFGCVLVKDCTADQHRGYEVKLFENPYQVGNNNDDWPIRFILSSYYFTHGKLGIPDGWSDCKICTTTCNSCKESVPYIPAHVPGECAYKGQGYTKVHRDIAIINAMRKWIGLGAISGASIGLPSC